jgi:hypothetical protein
MSKLKPVPCAKCGERPEVQDKRIRFVVICDCETPANYVFGNSVGFLDHIENEAAAQIAFDAINVNELKLTAIEAWNKEQEVLRLTAIATKHATRADELYEALEMCIEALERSYDATEWPADGSSQQEVAAMHCRGVLDRTKIDAVSNSNDD